MICLEFFYFVLFVSMFQKILHVSQKCFLLNFKCIFSVFGSLSPFSASALFPLKQRNKFNEARKCMIYIMLHLHALLKHGKHLKQSAITYI